MLSELDRLITDMCPDGVDWISLGIIMKNNNATNSISKKEYREVGKLPIIDQSQSYIVAYTDDESATPPILPCIIFGDHTRVIKYADQKFAQGDSGTKVFIPSNKDFNTKYVYYAFSNADIPSRGYNRHWSIAKDISIPMPPLPIQEEIVRILDAFTTLEAELEAELEARKKQYEYYRDELLSFGDEASTFMADGLVQCQKLSEVARMLRGDYITQKNTVCGTIPVILGGQEPAYYCNSSNHTGEAIVISRSGAYAGFVSYWNQPIFVTDGFILETADRMTIRYLFHWLKSKQQDLHSQKRGGGVPHVRGTEIMEMVIPVPPLSEQARIVAILDRFDALTNDIIHGLPAEIAARRKQYEYYRDKLLSFKEKVS